MNLARKIFLAVLCILAPLVVTYLAQRVSWRMDWTSEGLYSLSQPSRDILEQIEEPIEFTLYYTPDVEDIPASIRNFAQRVKTMLYEYAKAAPNRITVDIANPAPDTLIEEEAVGAGLSGQRMANGEVLYLGLVAKGNGGERVIPFLLPAREPALEYDLSRLILDLIHPEKPKIGILTSLDLWGKEANLVQGVRAEPPSILIQELRRLFEVVPLGRRGDIPEDLDMIALIHPRGVSDKMAFALDQYFLAGGPLLIAVDPSSAEVRRTHPNRNQLNGLGGPTESDIPQLLSGWGIQYNSRRVVGDFELATNVRLSAEEPELPHPLWLTFRDPESETPATTGLNEILLVEAGSFTVDNPDLRVTPILETTAQSGEMMASSVPITGVENLPQQISPDGRSEFIAALLQGVFPTAFPDGEPSENKEDDWIRQLEEEEDPSLKQSTGESNLVLVTDTDLFTDRFGTETVRYLSQQTTRRSNDNLALAVNLFELLAGGNELVELRGKGTVARPFLRVEDLAAQARVAYEKQLSQLEEELISVRNDIRGLESESTDEEKEISPEAEAEIQQRLQDFREKEVQLRREQREIRKELREEIRRLDRTLVLINLLVVPGLIALLALQYFLRRRPGK